jgi:CRP/FNR family transcriptional regulator, cyclic AMP receptor protein
MVDGIGVVACPFCCTNIGPVGEQKLLKSDHSCRELSSVARCGITGKQRFYAIALDHRDYTCSRMPSSLATKKNGGFNPNTFLATIGAGRKILLVPKKQSIFAQGDDADAVFYVQKGKVRLTVVSKIGKEATIAIVNQGNFFGEGSLAGQLLRMGSAAAMTDCEILRVEKKTMMDALHREPALSEMFVAYLLARNIRYEEDLVDQLFNSSEKRLARVLLLLAHFGKDGIPETVVPKMSQETLAEMVGTTRSRVSFFMNRFRKLGFIHYAGGSEGALQVHSSLLNVVLHD